MFPLVSVMFTEILESQPSLIILYMIVDYTINENIDITTVSPKMERS